MASAKTPTVSEIKVRGKIEKSVAQPKPTIAMHARTTAQAGAFSHDGLVIVSLLNLIRTFGHPAVGPHRKPERRNNRHHQEQEQEPFAIYQSDNHAAGHSNSINGSRRLK